jgi:6-phosphogluconolactonase (cycloisomerase 2 family)
LLYAVSETDDALVVFDWDENSGLTHHQTFIDGSGGVDGLDGAYSAAVSPDGSHVYVAGYGDDAIAIFRWIGSTLGFASVIKDSDTGVDGLNGANSVAVSPDGNHVYVAGRLDNAIACFERSSSSGLLTYQGMVQDGVNGVDGLNGARALAINPNGSQLYVASQWDDALAVFDRDPATGALTFVTAHKDGVDGVDGLDTADGIAVSHDGRFILVSGYNDDAIAVFSRDFSIYLPLVVK